MLQDYLHAYPPPTQADAYLQIQGMAQWLGVYLSKYPAKYINCMTSDKEFIAFINHAIQLALDLTTHPNICLYSRSCWKHKMSMHHMYR